MQREILTYLQYNYTEPLRLETLAEQFHLSEKYLSRYFKQHFHLTLTQYLMHLRLTHACHLLESTSLPVTEVALQSGFSNVSHFIRSFHASFRMSPLQCGQAAVVNRRRAIEHDRRDDDGVRPRIRQPARHGDFGQRQ